ncbi:MAG: TonB-dependent receptor [Chitinophagales bacterium]|nr:TonB-dependent receptor [Chitinophagales bacterium]
MRKPVLLLACILQLFTLSAQLPDSSLMLRPERLTDTNIATLNFGLQKTVVLSATRSEIEFDRQPFSVWVITAEDIQHYGFVTLGDVLRAAPGIKVSQPGNALEGETFMVRGLRGNQEMKIMINSVPIAPSANIGTPIGAQLPVRQAERIEVYFGPAAAIYGDAAAAGVVNIILRESERPLYTQADLSFGNFGYNSLDLMFGGKLGKDKRIFRFSLYGSNTIREKTDLYYDFDNTHNMNTYLPWGLQPLDAYYINQNFIPAANSIDYPKVSPIPHESRLFGLNLKWRGLQFSYHRMSRSDHMAIGRNPLAVSWATPSNRLRENLELYTLQFGRKRERRESQTILSVLRYDVDINSATSYILDGLSLAAFRAIDPPINRYSQALFGITNVFTSRERYTAGKSLDVRIDTRTRYRLGERGALTVGVLYNTKAVTPIRTHYPFPLSVSLFEFNRFGDTGLKPYAPQSDIYIDFIGYLQYEWHDKKWDIVLGSNAFLSIGNSDFVSTPRLGIQYRIDSSFQVRANFSRGVKTTNAYTRANAFVLDGGTGTIKDNISIDAPDIATTTAGEIGFRFIPSVSRVIEGTFFYQHTDNLVRNGYLNQYVDSDSILWRYGYRNGPQKSVAIWGVQGLITLYSTDFTLGLGKREQVVTWKNEFYMQYCRGAESFGFGLPDINDVRNQPRWMTQFRTSWRTGKVQLTFASDRQNGIRSGSEVYREQYQLNSEKFLNSLPAFRTWDATVRIYLSKYFVVYAHGQNIFGRRTYGIDATGTYEDLIYNPQPRRVMRFGINYSMN